MRVGILYTPHAAPADLLAEFADGSLHGVKVTATCEYYATPDGALFLGPAATFGSDAWIDGDAVAMVWAGDYPAVHAGFAAAGVALAATLAAT